MIDLNNRTQLNLFLERFESGDPLKDWYSDLEIAEAFAELIRKDAQRREEAYEWFIGRGVEIIETKYASACKELADILDLKIDDHNAIVKEKPLFRLL